MELIEGSIDNRDDLIISLQDEVNDLRAELKSAKTEAAQARREAARAMGALRRQLTPLYQALQMVFGELDTVGMDESGQHGPAANPRISAVWENWKSKLGPVAGKVIDALLLHGDMNATQLKIACACGQQTIYDQISKLNKAGLINKAGGRFSLKQL